MNRRRKSPLNKAEDKADRALQDNFRKLKLRCESCGALAEVMHHHVEKSLSLGLRFERDNLVPLCQGCHFRHHRVGDTGVMDRVIIKRGVEWIDRLNKLRLERKEWKKSIKFYEEQLELWSD